RRLTEPPPRLADCALELPDGEMFDAFIRTSRAIRTGDRYADADPMLSAFSALPALDPVAQSASGATRKTLTSTHQAPRSRFAAIGAALLTGAMGFGAGALAFRSSDAQPVAEGVAEAAADLGQAVAEASAVVEVSAVKKAPR